MAMDTDEDLGVPEDAYVVSAAALSGSGRGGGGAAAAAAGGGGGGEEEGAEGARFAPLSAARLAEARRGACGGTDTSEVRKVRVPPHRYSPLRENWDAIAAPIVKYLKLCIRMNTHTRCVELKASDETEEAGALQKAEEFVKAFMAGFEVDDALAILRMDDIYVESFDISDVRELEGDHLSRAIGRVAGSGGRTRIAIESATRTRIVVADSKIHILGAHGNVQIARDAVCSLIIGTPPGKVYNHMRVVAARIASRY
jgi:RNA-binding protein PNO1